VAGLQQLNWDSEGVGATAAALVDLSTVAGNKISNPPWVKFQSAGWVNFPSAPTHPRPIGQWPLLAGHRRGRWEQLLLQLRIGQRTGPTEAAGGKAVEVIADGDTTDLHADGNLASR